MDNRDFLMLAHKFEDLPPKHTPKHLDEWHVSEKLDGMRCFWDGGVSRGKLKGSIPWSTNKDPNHVCTGLWTRYCRPIFAPDWWLDNLPQGVMLDGELWAGRGQFQYVMSCRSYEPVHEHWHNIQYHVFDSPAPQVVFQNGVIRLNNQQKHVLRFEDCMDLVKPAKCLTFEEFLNRELKVNNVVRRVTTFGVSSMDGLKDLFKVITVDGGEGLMLRRKNSIWETRRSVDLIKLKETHKGVCTVVSENPSTDPNSWITAEGLVGSLTCEMDGVGFNVGSGFTREARKPGLYPPGTKIRIRFMSYTDDGIPREPRFKGVVSV